MIPNSYEYIKVIFFQNPMSPLTPTALSTLNVPYEITDTNRKKNARHIYNIVKILNMINNSIDLVLKF